MRRNKFMTAAVCAAILSVMTTFHAYSDTTAVTAAGTASGGTYVVAEASGTEDAEAAEAGSASAESTGTSAIGTGDLFSSRDLEQTADLTQADLRGADVSRTDLRFAKLKKTKIDLEAAVLLATQLGCEVG